MQEQMDSGELELAKCRNWIIEPDPFSMNEALPNLCNKVMPLRDSVQFMPARGSDTQLRHVQRPLQRNGIQCSLCQRAARFV